MDNSKSQSLPLSSSPFTPLSRSRRRAVRVSRQTLVTQRSLQAGQSLPQLIQPTVSGVDAIAWASHHRSQLLQTLTETGGILLRGFAIHTVDSFEQLMRAICESLLDYSYRSTPRTEISGKVYTSTEYPAELTIPLHNEMAYTNCWPLKIAFCCLQPAAQGGATPIADSRAVLASIPQAVQARFQQRQVMYVRNYGDGVDLSWQTVFQTESRAQVETYCRAAGIAYEWKTGDRLRTRQVCPAIATHPQTGELVWFNQAHLFHFSALGAEEQQLLLTQFAPEDLPRHAFYGDGSAIDPGDLAAIWQAYDQHQQIFSWQAGDVLLLDNMRVAHGRLPFQGPRQVVVSMADIVEHSQGRQASWS
ncbi:TauD/TfdA family dioxygenase [Oscillatoria sp. CS-180]|uniref:TauD/TfdA family dioxygenase n=1 Tax=Oscillatoria sp. CS-180 TaxID=3021720 RepID=UPI00232F5BE3|nr:TauD/TfdA family dioxygenase [Oscillatoria sp. CS-180]MDB9527415.1 TauD/TfdA family dioxygenase [Oscillatoria sp. CS-180]